MGRHHRKWLRCLRPGTRFGSAWLPHGINVRRFYFFLAAFLQPAFFVRVAPPYDVGNGAARGSRTKER